MTLIAFRVLNYLTLKIILLITDTSQQDESSCKVIVVEKNADCSESLNIPVNLEKPIIQENPALCSQNDVIQKFPTSYKDFINRKIYNEALFEAQISIAKLMISS